MMMKTFLLGGVALIAIIALSFAILYWENFRTPELGVRNGALMPLGKRPNAVGSQTDQAKKMVSPWPMKSSLAETLDAISAAVEQDHVESARLVERGANYLRFEIRTPTMRWRDDLEFFVNEQSQKVEVRSASRAGYSDRGANRARIERLRLAYEVD